LGKLVSSTEQLQQQVQVAQTIEPVSTAINATADSATSKAAENTQSQPNVELAAPTMPLNSQKDLPPLFPPAPKKLPLPQPTSQPLAEIKGERPPN
jgi:phospholipid/cholesterol/gamma-HCH transport system substrate-binding protein